MPETNAEDWYCISMDSPVKVRQSCAAAFVRSPLSLTDASSGRTFSYAKLPHHPFRLSVLKLDGSSFDIEVARTATVAELKQAIENVFSHFPQKGPGKISWSHVWSQFCLSYERNELLNDSEYVRNYGVHDGDQIHFVRHVSSTSSGDLTKRRAKKQPSRKQDGRCNNVGRGDVKEESGVGDVENQGLQYEEKEDINGLDETFKRWYLYSKLNKPEEKNHLQASKFSDTFLGSLCEVLHVSRDR